MYNLYIVFSHVYSMLDLWLNILKPSIFVNYYSLVITCTYNSVHKTPYVKINCNHESPCKTKIREHLQLVSSLFISALLSILVSTTTIKHSLVLQQRESLLSEYDTS